VTGDSLTAIEQLVATGEDADDVLRAVVAELVAGGCAWAGILFSEGGALVLGPSAGTPDATSRTEVDVTYSGEKVAELVADGCDDRDLLERVAALVSSHCLVGWDTGGEPWTP
jgi:putative methionine-R-sulfoxide reductase with GAF domain